jgi:cytochrome P450
MSDATAENAIVGDWGGADPFAPSFRDDPYPALNQLRENDPVNLTPVGTWRISRYADVADVFRNAPTSMTLPDGSSPNMDDQDNRGSFREFMLNKDGPDHIRLRRLVLGAFTPRALKNIEN